MSTELTPEELFALADDNYIGWEEDAREAIRDAAVNARILRERAAASEPTRTRDIAAINPSTIRDVQPPKDAA
ncbi:hypothetical protein HUN59_05300 [Curtobacterium sp. Csp2]|uniref:hypothetical protein n=1 Tax=Curtobacterium sp. Csp2 TaxID=2495430 RepID=UPI001580746A|nr:hypothetical protein [Curtobacterium sp. Csp2]QKS15713.1 hypothetical protein HUN59_05300 [Curtobacterium sp. Csp2]